MLSEVLNDTQRLAIFLDVDGTLLEIAATPEAVVVPDGLPELLREIWMRLDGALALVSGRALADLDRLFAPHRFPAAGVHGCELREPSGTVLVPEFDVERVRALHERLASFTFDVPGVLLEYKSFGIAIHYRLNPAAEPQVAARAQQLITEFAPYFMLQGGKCVYEIRPVGFSKGGAIRRLMELGPFTSRHPVFIGDDLTDESGFDAVNELGGTSIRVGEPGPATLAKFSLAAPADVLALLRTLAPRASARAGS